MIVAIIGGKLQGIEAVFLAKEAGYYTILIDKNPVVPASGLCDAFVCGDITANDPDVLAAMMRLRGRDMHREKLLMIGYGIVGREAEKLLAAEKIDIDIYDKDVDTTKGLKYNILAGKTEIRNYRNILDFTNEGGWLTEDCIHPQLIYATPGVPYSPDEKTAALIEESAVHDDLEIGTAVMLGEVIK